MVWYQAQQGDSVSPNRLTAVVESLPRSMVEHEKGMIIVFSHLLGLTGPSSKDSFLQTGVINSDSASPTVVLREPIGGIQEIFLNVFMCSVSAMKVLFGSLLSLDTLLPSRNS